MAFDFPAWLKGVMEKQNGEGKPLYSPETVQDLVALVLIASKRPIEKLSGPAASIFGAFLIRTGLDKLKPAEFQKALDAYFKAHPLPKELVSSFQYEFQREPTGKKQKMFRPIRG
jgi:hypothetical protein